jgi:NADP-dependent 3-hydroxy acid dehydrogenase YdfG
MGEALRQEVEETPIRVTLVQPGMVDTPFFDTGAPGFALRDDDVARSVGYALSEPPHVDVNEIVVRPVQPPG